MTASNSRNTFACLFAVLFVALVTTFGQWSVAAQQGGTTRYIYDANGRLRAVVSATGEVAVYDYDQAGNPTAIRRLGTDALLLFSLSPTIAVAGDRVTFTGIGFGPGLADNTVLFNGSGARVISATSTEIIAEVPDAATTGPAIINTPRGQLTAASSFSILPGLRVLPLSSTVAFSGRLQFSATVTPLSSDQAVAWSVNGIAGGDASVGTISATGLYKAPDVQIQAGRILSMDVTIGCASVALPALFAERRLQVRDDVSYAFATTSVRYGTSPGLTATNTAVLSVRSQPVVGNPGIASGAITVRRGFAEIEPVPAANAFLAVRRGLIEGLPDAIAKPITVRHGFDVGEPLPASATLLAIRRGVVNGDPSATLSLLVSATSGPNISGLSPVTLARGATLTLTLTGFNLSGAMALRFVDDNGVVDSGITASNFNISADGQTLTATLTVGATVTPGARFVFVTTPAGSSLTSKVTQNTIAITP